MLKTLASLACALLFLTTHCFPQQPITLTSGTKETLRGLSVVSSNIMWASGTHGSYLRTIDSGKTWTVDQVPSAEALDFRDVEAFSPSLAYLLAAGPGEQSRIYKTGDAGKRWELQLTNPDPQGFLDCMAFWDRDHGIVLGDPVDGKFVLFTTGDGGRHWKKIAPAQLPAAVTGEGAFAASGSCVAVSGKKSVWFVTGGATARVFHSEDRGKTWSVAKSPLPAIESTSGIFSVAFRDATHGVIAGGDYKTPSEGSKNLAFTTDGGKTWTLSQVLPQAYFSAAAFDSHSNRVFVVGTTFAGWMDNVTDKSWRHTWPLNLNTVVFDGEGNTIAVGVSGAVVQFPLAAK